MRNQPHNQLHGERCHARTTIKTKDLAASVWQECTRQRKYGQRGQKKTLMVVIKVFIWRRDPESNRG